ncbi:hypothetical protein RYA05_04675 [Pseudomonas syringae pv. actinidiae]|nr:hypothetical protein [Pseudomonas syringae pv. actinidiae]
MSNKLIIELTTFTKRGSDKPVLGFIAEDDYNTYVYRSGASTWEEFKEEFTSKESLFWKAVSCDGLSDLSSYVTFEGDEAVIEDEDAPVSAVYFEGCEELYA